MVSVIKIAMVHKEIQIKTKLSDTSHSSCHTGS